MASSIARIYAALFAAVFAATPVTVTAQSSPTAKPTSGASATRSRTPPRTPDKRPDLQGIWHWATVTPMERPAQFADKATLTEEEAAAFAKSEVERRNVDGRREGGAAADLGRSYGDVWRHFGDTALRRTSLVIDPPDGKIPALTPEAQKRLKGGGGRRLAEGPEELGVGARCLLGFNAGPPMFPGNYNNYLQIVQTRDHMMLLTEMVHDARSVPLDGRPFTTVRQWKGESRGRWEGDTLIIETKNFLRETAFPRSSANLHLIERFSLSGPDTLLYQFTLDDPTTWTKPWTAELLMTRTQDQIYEFACHERNEGMGGVLRGARAEEKQEK